MAVALARNTRGQATDGRRYLKLKALFRAANAGTYLEMRPVFVPLHDFLLPRSSLVSLKEKKKIHGVFLSL